ncbi:hypothetical protein QJS83_02935 [Bdellovibrio sp. 22V]|uniref:hypothetical protein n=1 Tax=Bdellovibrio TaxID=958 RepID=UPI002543126C|nr:hypothetical protein [Bdellovibrio sp. 22V]WII72823.1 hypothetical protein QJS83_02935 [Bdellovibrio sp. 22V]
MFSQRLFLLLTSGMLFLSGCASGTFKARQEQREKMASSTGMYCEFLSGDMFPDLDVELSMSMARRCDANKTFSITNYKNSSDQNGVIYCCSTRSRMTTQTPKKATPAKTESSEASDAEVISE